jgi:hypothetical protein
MALADVNGRVSYSGLENLIKDLYLKVAYSGTGLTAAEFSDLKTIARNLNNGMSTSSYLTTIFNDLVNGNPENATWTGGNRYSVSLGNLHVGSSATQLWELNGKWFLGSDLPSSYVSAEGSTYSVWYSNSTAPVFGAYGPSMNDVNQGALGDCYLLSSLAEVANHNPSIISSMITSNGNGTYGVRFFVNGQAQYVTVNSALADGGTVFNHGSDMWVSLVEKAYAQLQTGGEVTGNTGANYGNSWSSIGNGGWPRYALEEITGASWITEFTGNGSSWSDTIYNQSLTQRGSWSGYSTAQIQNALVADLNSGDDLILSSWTNAYDSHGRQTLVAAHAMSIYGFDRYTGMFEVRNPWGASNGSFDTTFEVSLSTLLRAGDTITVDNVGGHMYAASALPAFTPSTFSPSGFMGADSGHGSTMFADPTSYLAQQFLAPAHA